MKMRHSWIIDVIVVLALILVIKIWEKSEQHELSCPAPILVNSTKDDWNSYDTAASKLAIIQCGFKDSTNACLYEIEKTGIHQYNVTCGKKL